MARYTSDFRSSSRDSYKDFCEKNKHLSLTYDQFKDIIYTYNSFFYGHILETGEAIPLPRGLGKLSVQRKKTKTTFTDKKGVDHIILPINWPESKKQGKHVHYFNDHTDGWRFKWIWFKNTSTNLKMKDIWCFKPTREMSHKLRDYVSGEYKQKYIYTYTEWQVGRAKNKKK